MSETTKDYVMWKSHHDPSYKQTQPIIAFGAYSDLLGHISQHTDREVGGFLLGGTFVQKETGTRYTFVNRIARLQPDEDTPLNFSFEQEDYEKVDNLGIPNQSEVIGFFHSRIGTAVGITDVDMTLFNRYFRDLGNIVLVLNLQEQDARCYIVEEQYAKRALKKEHFFGFTELLPAPSAHPLIEWGNLSSDAEDVPDAPHEPKKNSATGGGHFKFKSKETSSGSISLGQNNPTQVGDTSLSYPDRFRLPKTKNIILEHTSFRGSPDYGHGSSDSGKIKLSGKSAKLQSTGTPRYKLTGDPNARKSQSESGNIRVKLTNTSRRVVSFAQSLWQPQPSETITNRNTAVRGDRRQGIIIFSVIIVLLLLSAMFMAVNSFGGNYDSMDSNVATQEPLIPNQEQLSDINTPTDDNDGNDINEDDISEDNTPDSITNLDITTLSQPLVLQLIDVQQHIEFRDYVRLGSNDPLPARDEGDSRIALNENIQFDCRWVTNAWYGVTAMSDNVQGYIYVAIPHGSIWEDANGDRWLLNVGIPIDDLPICED